MGASSKRKRCYAPLDDQPPTSHVAASLRLDDRPMKTSVLNIEPQRPRTTDDDGDGDDRTHPSPSTLPPPRSPSIRPQNQPRLAPAMDAGFLTPPTPVPLSSPTRSPQTPVVHVRSPSPDAWKRRVARKLFHLSPCDGASQSTCPRTPSPDHGSRSTCHAKNAHCASSFRVSTIPPYVVNWENVCTICESLEEHCICEEYVDDDEQFSRQPFVDPPTCCEKRHAAGVFEAGLVHCEAKHHSGSRCGQKGGPMRLSVAFEQMGSLISRALLQGDASAWDLLSNRKICEDCAACEDDGDRLLSQTDSNESERVVAHQKMTKLLSNVRFECSERMHRKIRRQNDAEVVYFIRTPAVTSTTVPWGTCAAKNDCISDVAHTLQMSDMEVALHFIRKVCHGPAKAEDGFQYRKSVEAIRTLRKALEPKRMTTRSIDITLRGGYCDSHSEDSDGSSRQVDSPMGNRFADLLRDMSCSQSSG